MEKQKIPLHTDEYELSLSRELSVCRKRIQRIKKTLELLEQKHNMTTDAFLAERERGALTNPAFTEDYETWKSSHESLRTWEQLEQEYLTVYRAMKI